MSVCARSERTRLESSFSYTFNTGVLCAVGADSICEFVGLAGCCICIGFGNETNEIREGE
jgi:hypothetical protein